MSREWKPGEVGFAAFGGRVMFVKKDSTPRWVLTDGSDVHVEPDDAVRPLVVIDPEDREQVERLWDAMEPQWRTEGWQWVQTALREFADPKPPLVEPLGLGAVVLTTNGHKFVRLMDDPLFPWALAEEKSSNRWHWSKHGGLDGETPAEVLSEGVTA